MASLHTSPPVSISPSVVMEDVENTRLWGSWERAAKLSNNTQTAVAVTGLKAALVIGENILNTVHIPFRILIIDCKGFISHEDQNDVSTGKESGKKKPSHQSILKGSHLDAGKRTNFDVRGSQGVSKADIKKKRTIFKESRHNNMSC